MTTTDRDIRTAVETALAEHTTTHDVDGIVREIISRHGLVDIESIDHDEFWSIVADHARPSYTCS